MKRFICIAALFCTTLGMYQVMAQPRARKVKQESKDLSPTLSVRAQTQYTGQVEMPDDVMWKREIYRTLDVKNEKNAALYYPVEPIGDKMNLFTLIFKLLADNKIPAYEYRLDGNESLVSTNKVNVKELLDRFHVYYQIKKGVTAKDTLFAIDNSDIPSGEVLSYYMKEVWYFDQHTSTYNSKVLALCPILHRSGDFGTDITKYPMFWINYKDVAPYLVQTNVMTSNLNNASNINLDDYFTMRMYKGDIYKVTNMLNQTLSQYCATNDEMIKEQKKIESQLKSFEQHLWAVPSAPADSTLIAPMAKDAKKEDTRAKSSLKTKKIPSAPKASIRRQRG